MRITLTEQDRITLGTYVRAHDKIHAVLTIRQATGLGLREAMDFLVEFEQQLTPPLPKENKDMSMTSYVMAIGPFRKELADYLEYPAEDYVNTQEGIPVVCRLFECGSGSSQSREMAACSSELLAEDHGIGEARNCGK